MNTKLTLRLDDDLIRSAKRYSAQSGKSVSQLVADYFAVLATRVAFPDAEPTPRVRSLHGALAGSGVDVGDYRRHLERKHT